MADSWQLGPLLDFKTLHDAKSEHDSPENCKKEGDAVSEIEGVEQGILWILRVVVDRHLVSALKAGPTAGKRGLVGVPDAISILKDEDWRVHALASSGPVVVEAVLHQQDDARGFDRAADSPSDVGQPRQAKREKDAGEDDGPEWELAANV
jgi:hypothetical protein